MLVLSDAAVERRISRFDVTDRQLASTTAVRRPLDSGIVLYVDTVSLPSTHTPVTVDADYAGINHVIW